MPVATLFSGTTRGIAFHDIQLRFGGVAFGAVRQLSGQSHRLKRRFADDQVACFLRCVAGARGCQTFLHNRFACRGVVLEEAGEGVAHYLLNIGLYLGIHQLYLSLAFKLRIRVLDTDNCCHAFAGVIAAKVAISVF